LHSTLLKSSNDQLEATNLPYSIIESRLEGGWIGELKFTTLNTLEAGVSVRIHIESRREGKTNQPRK
jgi:hypothetical protein